MKRVWLKINILERWKIITKNDPKRLWFELQIVLWLGLELDNMLFFLQIDEA